jgi:hypothetical protein
MIFDTTHEDRKVRHFTLSPSFVSSFAGKQPQWGPVGYFTYKRTYALPLNPLEPDGPSEEFWQTCQRVVEGTYTIQKIHCRQMGLPWDNNKAQRSAQEMFQRMWDFKFLPPGRGLSKMGTPFMYAKGGSALNNCAYISTENIDEDFADPFAFLMDMSMLGVGVGGDTAGAGKVTLHTPRLDHTPYVVEDSREGWVAVTRTFLNSFVLKGALPTVVDTRGVRRLGSPILGFGGVASGPNPLVKMLRGIVQILLPVDVSVSFTEDLDDKGETLFLYITLDIPASGGTPRKIVSEEIGDIFNLEGACVVAGGVRRSAEILFGNEDDDSFRSLKDDTALRGLYALQGDLAAMEGRTPEQDELLRQTQAAIEAHPLRTHRWASNNSIFGHVGMDYRRVAADIARNGEPGIFWLKNAQDYGRMCDPPNYLDRRARGSNPCVEQTLESYELCCLVETFPALHASLEDFKRTLKFAYLYAKTVTLLPTHNPRTNAVMTRNRRIGCSMSGIRQAIEKLGRRNFLNWCDSGYKYIDTLDIIYSDWLGVPRSIKKTSIKPSGTVSLLPGATPGIHTAHSEFYIRNIRVATHSPYVAAAIAAGYRVEKDAYADNTSVISFPVKVDNFSQGKRDVSIWEQVALASDLQRYWADNQVSVTVTFSAEEASQIPAVLEAFEDRIKSVSFLPLGEDHGYVQAPYIEITEEQYLSMIKGVTPLDLSGSVRELEEKFCDGEACVL